MVPHKLLDHTKLEETGWRATSSVCVANARLNQFDQVDAKSRDRKSASATLCMVVDPVAFFNVVANRV